MLNPVLAMAIGIVVMMVLIIFTKMHAFPSLIISAILIAVLAMPFGPEGATVATLTECVSTVTKGFGNTMASIGVVIGFGCIMGIFLEKSGAAKRMALTILKMVGVKNCDVVLGLTGFVVSIPVFCDSGFVILSSLAGCRIHLYVLIFTICNLTQNLRSTYLQLSSHLKMNIS